MILMAGRIRMMRAFGKERRRDEQTGGFNLSQKEAKGLGFC